MITVIVASCVSDEKIDLKEGKEGRICREDESPEVEFHLRKSERAGSHHVLELWRATWVGLLPFAKVSVAALSDCESISCEKSPRVQERMNTWMNEYLVDG